MTLDHKLLIAAAAAPLPAVAVPLQAFADAVGTPGDVMPAVGDSADRYAILMLGLLALVVAIAIVVALRPAWRRRIAAMLTGLMTSIVGLLLVVGGLFFSDWSGNHQISWPIVIGGFAVLLAGLFFAARMARPGHPR